MSPKPAYNLGVEYKMAFDNGMSLTPRLNLSHISGSYFYATYRPNAYPPARNSVSGQITPRHDDWSAEPYGTNLTGKRYIAGSTHNNLFDGAPREFGVRVTKEF